ncbi:protease 3 precursor [bacterium BMS3Abin04]|nr:protease 3 precursor [bacterium BMS3Abin04]
MINVLNIEYEKFKLNNNLDVVLYQDKSLPIVAVNIWYKVGSANEQKGKTGLAHLFEHMMFQGSEHVPKEMHFRYIQEAGGTLNGSTSIDRTNFYESVPSTNLEMVLWLESDRMGYFLPALSQEKLDNQIGVVSNERRQNYENQPYGLAWEKLFSTLYPENYPYHWPTIGWMKDIENYNLEDVKKFFNAFYSPQNASLVIGGNFEFAEAKDLVESYFGNIINKTEIPKLNVKPPKLTESNKVILKDDVQLPRLYLAWISDKAYGNDDAKLDILADILTGSKNSRLYKKLLIDKQIAQDVSAFQYSGNLNGAFIIVATPKPGVKLDVLKKEIFNQINFLLKSGITKGELRRSVNSYKSSFIYSLQNLDNLANQINNYNCFLNEPNSFIYDIGRYEKVTGKDVISVTEKYLNNNFVELNVMPNKKN